MKTIKLSENVRVNVVSTKEGFKVDSILKHGCLYENDSKRDNVLTLKDIVNTSIADFIHSSLDEDMEKYEIDYKALKSFFKDFLHNMSTLKINIDKFVDENCNKFRLISDYNLEVLEQLSQLILNTYLKSISYEITFNHLDEGFLTFERSPSSPSQAINLETGDTVGFIKLIGDTKGQRFFDYKRTMQCLAILNQFSNEIYNYRELCKSDSSTNYIKSLSNDFLAFFELLKTLDWKKDKKTFKIVEKVDNVEEVVKVYKGSNTPFNNVLNRLANNHMYYLKHGRKSLILSGLLLKYFKSPSYSF